MQFKMFDSFFKSESGAVTVDWVILTAAIVGMGMAAVALIAPNLKPIATGVGPVLDSAPGLGAALLSAN